MRWWHAALVAALWAFAAGSASAAPGQCNDPWVTKAVAQVKGRPAQGEGNGGECNIMLYGNGRWSSYDDLVAKVRQANAAPPPGAKPQPAPPSQPAASAAAPQVSFTSPRGGESFRPGQRVPLNWNYQGNIAASNGTIILYQGDNPMPGLAVRVPVGQGAYAWDIPQEVRPGTYRIFMGVSNVATPFYSGTFTVEGPRAAAQPAPSQPPAVSVAPPKAPSQPAAPPAVSVAPQVTFTSPRGGESFRPGQRVPLNWNYQGNIAASNGTVVLYQGDKPMQGLAVRVPVGQGAYAWDIPQNVAPGTYRIFMGVTNVATPFYSGTFTVEAPPTVRSPGIGTLPTIQPRTPAAPAPSPAPSGASDTALPAADVKAFIANHQAVGTVLGELSSNVIIPLIHDKKEHGFNREALTQSAALIAAYRDLVGSGRTLERALSGQPVSLRPSASEVDEATRRWRKVLVDIVLGVNPEAVIEEKSRPGAFKPIAFNLDGDRGVGTKILNTKINWNGLDRAQRVVVLIQAAHAFAKGQTSIETFQPWYDKVAEKLTPLLDKVPDPRVQAAARAIDALGVSMTIANHLLTAAVALMPSRLSEFYVDVDNAKRKEGDPPVIIGKKSSATLSIYVIPESPGGHVVTPHKVALEAFDMLVKKLPKKWSTGNAERDEKRLESVKNMLEKVIERAEEGWKQIVGKAPPNSWLSKASLEITAPRVKHQGVEINDERVVSVVSGAPSALRITKRNDKFVMDGLQESDRTPYTASLKTETIVANLPTLAEVASAGGIRHVVRGEVTIKDGHGKPVSEECIIVSPKGTREKGMRFPGGPCQAIMGN